MRPARSVSILISPCLAKFSQTFELSAFQMPTIDSVPVSQNLGAESDFFRSNNSYIAAVRAVVPRRAVSFLASPMVPDYPSFPTRLAVADILRLAGGLVPENGASALSFFANRVFHG